MKLIANLRAASVALTFLAGSVCYAQTATGTQKGIGNGAPKPSARAAVVKDSKTGFSYALEPAPAWVVPARERASAPVEPASMQYRVIDEQVRVDAKSVLEYAHIVRVVNDANGLSAASQIELTFDPSYQTLALHHLRVVRDGKPLDRLGQSRIELLQREMQLERRMYDGRATLSVVVDDVRPGDQVDLAYSIRGANPVFDGKFVYAAWMSRDRGPAALIQVRLLASAGRRIAQRVGPSDVAQHTGAIGDLQETVFRREAVPQARVDAGAPYSALVAQQLQFSEYSDWGEVARWGQSLFDPAGPAARVDQVAADIRARTARRPEQLLAALQFVQQDIRYFGTEIGENTHRPANADKVIEQRFGDCKDKVSLLVALLRRLDIDAKPVLVSLAQRGHVQRMLPSPLAFDHVIARVDLDGQTYWLDATRGHQSGTLANRQAVGFGAGLPLDAAATSLAMLPVPYDTERMSVTDTIRIGRFDEEPNLESRITYRGDLADLFREVVSTRSPQDVATALATPYAKLYPSIRSTASLRIEPSTDDDAVTFVQQFAIPDFWRFHEQRMLAGDVVHWSILEALSFPKTESRRDSYAFGFPGRYRQRIVLDFPEAVYAQPSSQAFDDGDAHFSLEASVEASRNRVEYLADLRIGADEVVPAQWAAHTSKVGKLGQRLGSVVAIPSVRLDQVDALNRKLKEAEESMRSKRVKVVTRRQVEASYKIVLLTEQLASGRLRPALEAEALIERGIQYDNLGRYDAARADFARAIELVPEAVEALNPAAVNALLLKEFGRAFELSSRVLDRSPRNAEASHTRALAAYFAKNLGAAEGDWSEMLKDRSAVRRGYPVVWLSLAMRQRGLNPAATAPSYASEDLPTQWPRPLINLALGSANAEELIHAAKAEKNPLESLCEAYFYIGERYYAEGDVARAKEYWQKSIDLGVVEFLEDGASRIRLASVAVL